MPTLGQNLAGQQGVGQRTWETWIWWWRSPGKSEMLQWMEHRECLGLFFSVLPVASLV